ncbi:GMC family oxidoreductase [Celeribacter indicus]|uniref:GMC oxidoreductase n=1 Tax=Celeribacter indicus TaxID=1208324 RepID=A0A0B5DTF4_9RHOB|nr:GMC family oxidoreductase N-terminal domain-containing protein [Celeribacter indicus]AJE46708.1 GMC oxidoreductase [Celeribacter indicus]SDX04476.1 Choline dehydrogenase [Celeribacter indicus]
MSDCDYIVIGSGSGGAVVARRLIDAGRSVILIEAGPSDRTPFIHIPGAFVRVIGTHRTWAYATEPEPGANGRVMHVPQGRTLGGSSSVNAMIYIRGDAEDYDGWARQGAVGWGYDDVLPYFRKAENNARFADEFHGSDGPLRVSDTAYGHPLAYAFVRAAQQAGAPYNADFNGARQEGVGFYQSTTFDGRRASTAVTYLGPVRRHRNLTIHTEACAEQLTLEGDRVTGLTCRMKDGTRKSFTAREEVILCAGGIGTPKLLQLSGIGDPADFSPHGIGTRHVLPGVGKGFQDHVSASVYGATRDPVSLFGADRGLKAMRHGVQYLLFRTGLLTSNVIESGGFIDTAGAGRPDVQIHVVPSLVGDADREAPARHGLSLNPCCLRPTSRGSVRISSGDPEAMPAIQANNLTTQEDIDTLVRGVEFCRKVLKAPALAQVVSEELAPGPDATSREAVEDHCRQFAKTVYHPSCTARMGTGEDAVVDPELRVRGLKGLRIADASVMPKLVSGNTNAPTVMIGERCAAFLGAG